ncbi:MAG: DUF2974 domain-containing protein [Lagierella massiliensis]|nr:DUF2974 domain-containing protein [Lagierella massiliensis]
MTYNIYDYLNFRGDLSFIKDEFNPVDAVLFSRLSYLPFQLIMNYYSKLTLKEVQLTLPEQKDFEKSLILPEDKKLLEEISKHKRFKDIEVRYFVNDISLKQEKQFSAVTFILPNNTAIITYRGTDKNIVGWKEDFNLSYLDHIPSHVSSINYLNEVSKHFENIILNGHSKGGNLSLYSLTHCDTKIYKKILKAFNFDGPGLLENTITDEIKSRADEKMTNYLPQGSIVGILLKQAGRVKVVSSIEKDFKQHYIYSWNVIGNDFLYLPHRTPESLFAESTLNQWVLKLSIENRQIFFDTIYELFTEIGKTQFEPNITNKDFIKTLGQLTFSLGDLPSEQRRQVIDSVMKLLKIARKNYILFKSKRRD